MLKKIQQYDEKYKQNMLTGKPQMLWWDTKSRYWLFGAAIHRVTKPGILMPVPDPFKNSISDKSDLLKGDCYEQTDSGYCLCFHYGFVFQC